MNYLIKAVIFAISCRAMIIAVQVEVPTEPFWITVELLAIEWKTGGCLNTGGCGQPGFRLTTANRPIDEQMSIDWPIGADFMQQDKLHKFVSSWTHGRISDMTVTCQIVGVDPTYGFPRICDATSVTAIFDDQLIDAASLTKEDSNILVDLKGNCFNATLTVTPRIGRCPWCPNKNDQDKLTAQVEEKAHSTQPRHLSSSSNKSDEVISTELLELVGVCLLASLAMLSTAATALMAIIYLRNKKRAKLVAADKAKQILEVEKQLYEQIANVMDGGTGGEPLIKSDQLGPIPFVRHGSVPYWYLPPQNYGNDESNGATQPLTVKTILRMMPPKQISTSSTTSSQRSSSTGEHHSDSGVELV